MKAAGEQEEEETHNGLRRAVELRERRSRRWREQGERSIGRNLAMMGALGWLMVAPMLLGAFIGRWLDRVSGEGVIWTAALIFAGSVFGGYLVWRRITEEPE
jgi:ATP synthase protein I